MISLNFLIPLSVEIGNPLHNIDRAKFLQSISYHLLAFREPWFFQLVVIPLHLTAIHSLALRKLLHLRITLYS